MSDAPIVGKLGEPPTEPEIDEGSLLFDPDTLVSVEAGDPLAPEEEPGVSRLPWIIGVVVVTLLGGGLVVTQGGSEPVVTDTGELPPMVPSVSPSTALADTIMPVPSADFQGLVNTNVLVGVRTIGRAGATLRDTVVSFRVDQGNAVLMAESVRTSREGIAVATLTLPPRPGTSIVFAAIPGSEISEARMVVQALPGQPVRMTTLSGNRQSAEIGELLPARVFVSVEDAEGNAVPGASVRFRITSGDGLTAPSQSRTDSLGQASALWRLGMERGPQNLAVTSPDFEGSVSFSATAQPRQSTTTDVEAASETAAVTVIPNGYSIGGSHVCKLTNGRLQCRGGDDRGQSRAQAPTTFLAVSSGASHSCALAEDGVASCWGSNDGGQLGNGTRSDRSTPVAVRSELRFSVLVTGSAHTCGLAGSGIPLCWGQNLSGQLGDGTRNDQTLPRTVGGGLAFRSLAAGWSHTCGLTGSGNAFCWGLNSQGQLGEGSRLDRLVPSLVRGGVEALVAGRAHTCALSEGQVLCWGSNSFGELGDGSAEDRTQPVEVQGIPGEPTDLAAGALHTCALLVDGRAYCWGQNLQGQLGDGSTDNRSTPVAVTGGLRFTEIHAGGAQTCGIASDGAEYCWGLNQSGQLGDGTRVSRSTPARVIG